MLGLTDGLGVDRWRGEYATCGQPYHEILLGGNREGTTIPAGLTLRKPSSTAAPDGGHRLSLPRDLRQRSSLKVSQLLTRASPGSQVALTVLTGVDVLDQVQAERR